MPSRQPGQTVIEATSGNTGIALAMVCAQKGYPLVVTMSESFSIERRKLLRFLGAKVVLTPAAEKGSGMLAKAIELAEKNGWYLCRQFENEANAEVHSRTTAQEILADFAGERLDYWVSGAGTGGTLKGVARALKSASPATKVAVAEPDNAQILASGIPQPRNAPGARSVSHPRFSPHLMQGWSPDFIAQLTQDAVASGYIDEIVPVAGTDALRLARELAQQEGIFVGTSSGATLAAALDVARRSPPGTNIVCMLPDTGERYMSTPLFDGVGAEMTADELAPGRSRGRPPSSATLRSLIVAHGDLVRCRAGKPSIHCERTGLADAWSRDLSCLAGISIQKDRSSISSLGCNRDKLNRHSVAKWPLSDLAPTGTIPLRPTPRSDAVASTPETLVEPRPAGSKLDLIQAAALAISRFGLSALTSTRIATAAGHTAASINFHFGSKEALLLATLREVSDEFAAGMTQVLDRSGDDALQGLLGVIDASLSVPLSEPHKIAVWYAFLGEANARADYQRICGERDQSYNQMLTALCTRVIAAHGASKWPDAEAVSIGLAGLIDQLWQGILFEGDAFDREAGKRQCRAYLCSVFPWLAERVEAGNPALASLEDVSATEPGLRYTLPAWVYHNDEFHELEKEHVFLPSWQIVCHVSEVSRAGDYVAFEFFGQRGFVVRDEAGTLRAFHNVCAHRAHAVVAAERGTCGKFLRCNYHGWTYHLDGRNRSVSAPDTFPKFDRSRFGLKPIELETFMGMVFIRCRGGEPSVAERMQPHRSELAHYRIEQMVPLDDLWEKELEIDWKNVVENYVEDYHFPLGHRGLVALMEPQYDREVLPAGTMRLSHRMREEPLKSWSAQHYGKFLPEIEHLPQDMRRRWTYLGLWPNVFFDIYPEWLDFFQVLPAGAGRTRIRARSYGFADDRREMRAARYLCTRLNARVQNEDEVLTRSVQQGLASGAYTQGILSDKEVVLAGFQDWLRAKVPVSRLAQAPLRGTVAARNEAVRSRADTTRSRGS